MKDKEEIIKEIRRQCFYLQDRENFINNIMMPVKEMIPHDAAGVGSALKSGFDKRMIYHGYPQQYLIDYTNIQVEASDTWSPHFSHQQPVEFSTMRTSDTSDYKSTEIYKALYEPYGFKRGMQSFYFDTSGALMGVAGITKRTEPEFTEKEKDVWEKIGPYVFYAYRKYRWFVNAEIFSQINLEDLLLGLIITDPEGKVIFINEAAKGLITPLNKEPDYIPDDLRPCLDKQLRLLEKAPQEQLIFRDVEEKSPFGNIICTAFNQNASPYLPADGNGFLFFIDAGPAAVDLRVKLSKKELQVLGYIVKGSSDKQIADNLNVVDKTASAHVASIIRKMGVKNRTEAAVKAMKMGLV